MPGHDIIVVGASAGGVEALTTLVRGLPADLPAAVFVVLHIPATSTSMLPQILSRAGALSAYHPADGDPIRHGKIYVAPPDRHLLVDQDIVRVIQGPRENACRPAVDPLFRTAARAYGPRVSGVVLTGGLDDGTAGLLAIKRRGGIAVVQDPATALVSSMPESALRYVEVDHCATLAELAPLLTRLAYEPVTAVSPPVSEVLDMEAESAHLNPERLESTENPGTLSAFTCPECHGPLWQINDSNLLRFRCRTGHAYTAESMLAEQAEGLEAALWMALNILEESALMSERLASQSQTRGHDLLAQRFAEKAAQARRRAALIRQVLLNGEAMTTAAGPGPALVESEPPTRQQA